MAFGVRTGVFMSQMSEKVITMVLYCPSTECREPVIDRNDLMDHMWNKHKIKRFACLWPDCGQSFDDFERLGQHVRRTHGRNQTWKCIMPSCTQKFRSHSKLHQHVYQYHSDGLFRCGHPGCGFGPYDSRNTIYLHFNREHRPKGFDDPFAEATEEDGRRNNPCAICVRPMTRFSQNRRLPHCVHAFHRKCLLEWIPHNPNCPSCQVPIHQPDQPT